jgi:hypothetical protein
MAVDCDPKALAQAASCMQACVNAGMSDAVKIYLLATIAGVDPDPAALMQAAGCIQSCIPTGAMPAVQATLLCAIANAGGNGGEAMLTGEPSDELLFSQLGIDAAFLGTNLVGVTAIVFRVVNFGGYFNLDDCEELLTVSFPNMLTFGAGFDSGIEIESCALLTSFSAPLLTTLNCASFAFIFNSVLVEINLPNLVSVPICNIVVNGNASLANINWPNWVPTPGFVMNFADNALTAASVNHILARCVASPTWGALGETLDINGGTNAAPTGQGIIDVGVLSARGAGIFTN